MDLALPPGDIEVDARGRVGILPARVGPQHVADDLVGEQHQHRA
jgi:hypothetical protein